MKLSEITGINIYKNYCTATLQSVEKEDAHNLFKDYRVLYLQTNFFSKELRERRSVYPNVNSAIRKKNNIYSLLASGAQRISVDYNNEYKKRFYKKEIIDSIIHVPVLRCNKVIDKIFLFMSTLYHLITYRKQYDAILFYNFYLFTSFPSLIMHFFFGKKIFIDYEDSYMITGIRFARSIVGRYLNGAVLVNRHQKELLHKNVPYITINSFADFSYLKSIDEIREAKIEFIYSGKADYIRGVDLIPKFSYELTQRKIVHHITITGYGEFKRYLSESLFYPQVKNNISIKGYLNNEELESALSEADVALSFDRPDVKKNKYLFPSKIETYAKYRLPILRLEEC